MPHDDSAPGPARSARATLLAVLAVVGVSAGPSALVLPPAVAARPAAPPTLGPPRRPALVPPGGATVLDDASPAVAGLDPALRAALRRAAAAAPRGVRLVVTSGRRSRAHQERLWREAVARFGSEREAARWVARPDASAHVSGRAVDVGPPGAAAWLAAHGARYGLCRIYRNEPWHFERQPAAPRRGCAPLYADATRGLGAP